MHELPKDVPGGGKAEEHVTIYAPVDEVWRAFTNIERWAEFCEVYDYARWLSGSPWTVGSTFQARMRWPVPITVTHVVMSAVPEHEIRWLVHAIGIVIERWIRFTDAHGHTEITSSAIFFGTSTQQLPAEISDLLPQYTHRFYTDFKAACERAHISA